MKVIQVGRDVTCKRMPANLSGASPRQSPPFSFHLPIHQYFYHLELLGHCVDPVPLSKTLLRIEGMHECLRREV